MLDAVSEAAQRPTRPEPARTQAHEDITLHFGCPDVNAACSFLQSTGVFASEPKTAPYRMGQLSFRDPDGGGFSPAYQAKEPR